MPYRVAKTRPVFHRRLSHSPESDHRRDHTAELRRIELDHHSQIPAKVGLTQHIIELALGKTADPQKSKTIVDHILNGDYKCYLERYSKPNR